MRFINQILGHMNEGALIMKKQKTDIRIVNEKSTSGAGATLKNTAQKTIPFVEQYENSMFLVENKKGKEIYSLCFSFDNTNYSVLTEEKKLKINLPYQAIFNSLSPDVCYQEIYLNKPIESDRLHNLLAPKFPQDSSYCEAYAENQHNFIKDIENSVSDTALYFAISYTKKTKLDNVYNILMQAYSRVAEHLEEMGVKSQMLTVEQALGLLYDIYNPFDIGGLQLPPDMYKRGTRVRDYIAPSSFLFKPKYTALGSVFNRVLYVSGYSNFLEDSFITALLDNSFRVTVSKHVQHVSKDNAVKEVTGRLRTLESDKQTRNARNKREGTNYIPYQLQKEIESCEEILTLLQEKEELFDIGIYIGISAEHQEDLDDITKLIIGICSEYGVKTQVATFRQEDALASILPFATDKLKITSYLLSSAVGVTAPFTYERKISDDGFYYGRNAITRSPIIINRKDDKNGNGFYTGKSGSGKSIYAKLEINDILFQTQTDKVIVIDPEREFVKQCDSLGGTVVKISPNTTQYINPFDVNETCGRHEDMVKNKADLLLSIFAVFKGDKLTAKEKTIVDRCTQLVYRPFIESGFKAETIPTFEQFAPILKGQAEEESKDLSLYLEMYVTGTVNLFSHKTNVDMTNRYIVFDLLELNANLKKAAMLIILDHIWNEILNNFDKGIYTWLYADEFHLFYGDNEDNNSSGVFFERVFARCRKYGGLATGLTQNITNVLKSDTALSMLQNSQFVVLLEQASENLKKIASLYDLSEKQQGKLASCKMGEGLLVTRNISIPFNKLYPKNNVVYDTITTDFKDKIKTM